MKKNIKFHTLALKELQILEDDVSKRFWSLIFNLSENGYLKEPDSKKLGSSRLFELRVRIKGQWRALYAYSDGEDIYILRFFHKKTQKTPPNELKLAQKRLKEII